MTTADIQTILGVNPDGVWGPKSQAALNTEIGTTVYVSDVIERIQAGIGVNPDGQWGPKSQAALNAIIGAHVNTGYHASSFADPADLIGFQRCKRTGRSDVSCFKEGDNGVGQFGAITAQDHTPMVAVNHTEMVAKWGSEHGAAHRLIEVTVNGRTFNAAVEDRISAPGRIDLNPACAKIAHLDPPFVVPCTWKWVA